jgi:hypothetical protein
MGVISVVTVHLFFSCTPGSIARGAGALLGVLGLLAPLDREGGSHLEGQIQQPQVGFFLGIDSYTNDSYTMIVIQ